MSWMTEETYARLGGLGGLGSSPEVHDRAFSIALSRSNRARMAAQKYLNKINPTSMASIGRYCPRALQAIGIAHAFMGQVVASRRDRGRPLPPNGPDFDDLASADKIYREALRDVEAYFREFCVQGHSLTPEQTREANKLIVEGIDEVIRRMPRIPGRRGKLRLVRDDE
jgi:hypothetical protein